ncbi:MAG: YfhO family protein, partial [Lewinella sp.]|nr:YfhO family protein [Lewinella sp.]
RQGNTAVVNMLNTKYIIAQGANGPEARRNPEALGNAWLVSQVQSVSSNQAELNALTGFNPRTTAIVHQDFAPLLAGLQPDGNGSIRLNSYSPDRLTYAFNSSSEQLAIFSEIWYGPNTGWTATIDGAPAELLRANYVLRGLKVPAGQHEIALVFAPSTYTTGKLLSWLCSLLILLGSAAYVFFWYRGRQPSLASHLQDDAPKPRPAEPSPVAAAKPRKNKNKCE